jgi:hypothetical protein
MTELIERFRQDDPLERERGDQHVFEEAPVVILLVSVSLRGDTFPG